MSNIDINTSNRNRSNKAGRHIGLAVATLLASSTLTVESKGIINSTKTTISGVIEKDETIQKLEKIADKFLTPYKIKRGDNFNKIANKFGISEKELGFIKKITEPGYIKDITFLIAGTNILVPASYDDFLDFKDAIRNVEFEVINKKKSIAFEKGDMKEFDKLTKTNFFPESVQYIGLEKISKALLENMKNKPLNTYNPQFVDVLNEKGVNCAGMMRSFYNYSIPLNNRSSKFRKYLNTENIDAWELSEEFKKIGFISNHNFMEYFDHTRIGKREIVGDNIGYNKKLLEVGNEFNSFKIPVGSMILSYFKLSRFKNSVKQYNKNKPIDKKSINTHAMVYLGVGDIDLQSNEIKSVVNGKILDVKFGDKRNIIKLIIDFVQQRGGYNSTLSNKTRNDINNNLKEFSSLIKIYVNGKEVNIDKELNLKKSDKLEILGTDNIKIRGGIVGDGYHDSLSTNQEISKENNFRTSFFWESVLTGMYSYSEILEENGLEKEVKETKVDKIISSIEIDHLYDLKAGENIKMKLTEAILSYKFGKIEELKVTKREEVIAKKIKDNEKIKRIKYAKELNEGLVILRKEKIKDIEKSLSKEEKRKLKREYIMQIKGLQLYGFMQTEGQINLGTTKINAPIPYFNTDNIGELYDEYVDYKRVSIEMSFKNNKKNNFVDVIFLPGDNSAKIYNSIERQLDVHTTKYPNFKILGTLNVLQKNYFLEKCIDLIANNKKIDVSNGKFNSFDSVAIGLDYINKVLEEIKYKIYITDLEVSELDNAVISIISKTVSDEQILKHIISKESYGREGHVPYRKMKKIFALMLRDISGGSLNFISSYGDYQIRTYNLLSSEALNVWPTKENILDAISLTDLEEIKKWINRRETSNELAPILKNDKKILAEIVEDLTYMKERKRELIGKKTYESLSNVFRFDDGTGSNILGKIVQTLLVKYKLDGELERLKNWLHKGGLSIDNIHNDDKLRSSIEKLRLEINNKSERKVLLGITENYILRVLSTVDNITSVEYPNIKTGRNDQLINRDSDIEKRFSSYKRIIRKLDNELEPDIKKSLLNYIKDIVSSELNVNKQFELFKDDNIKLYLLSKGEQDIFIPTLKELEGGGSFRNQFFGYSRPSLGRTGPKISNFEYLDTAEVKGGLGGLLVIILGGIGIRFRKKIKSVSGVVLDKIKELKNRNND